MDIKLLIKKLTTKYQTTNPFLLSNALGITIFFEELGSINGYYNKQLRMKQIHINCNLDEHLKHLTCAHELGHSLLHPKINTIFLSKNTLLSVDKIEMEANKFAVELLITDELINDYKNYSIEQLSLLFGYHRKLIELRLNNYL